MADSAEPAPSMYHSGRSAVHCAACLRLTQTPRMRPSPAPVTEVLQALAQVMQQQVALAQAQATQLVDGAQVGHLTVTAPGPQTRHAALCSLSRLSRLQRCCAGYDDYGSYGADDGGGSRLGGGGASLAKARALAALARDRREVLQEERRARDGARVPPRGDIMLSSAGEGARGRDGRGDVSQREDGDEDSAPPQRGMSASEEQRQQQVRSALASLRSAREAGDVGDVALWDADVEDSFQRQEAGAGGLRCVVRTGGWPMGCVVVERPCACADSHHCVCPAGWRSTASCHRQSQEPARCACCQDGSAKSRGRH